MTVLPDERDIGRGGGWWVGAGGGEGEVGDPSASSSGLAMRSPPNDCDRLKSPDILCGVYHCDRVRYGSRVKVESSEHGASRGCMQRRRAWGMGGVLGGVGVRV